MVKKNRKEKAAPFLARSREDDIKRRTRVEEADASWARQEATRNPSQKKEPEPFVDAFETAFVSHSPMSDIEKEASDNGSVDEILPFFILARNSEDGISARISEYSAVYNTYPFSDESCFVKERTVSQ